MAQYADSPKSLEAGEALEQYRRVCLNGSATAEYADAAEYGVGVTQEKVASGAHVSVRDYRHGGTHKMTASAAITCGKRVYAAADGKVAPTGTLVIGTALEAASGTGSIIEVWPHPGVTPQSSSSSSSSASS